MQPKFKKPFMLGLELSFLFKKTYAVRGCCHIRARRRSADVTKEKRISLMLFTRSKATFTNT